MPIYEFKCKECQYEFDRLFLTIDESNLQIIKCPKCGNDKVDKKMVRITIVGKGCHKKCDGCRCE